MDGATLYVALGTTIAILVSLGAAGISLFSLLRPQRDHARIQTRLSRLEALPQEWENTLSALDSMNKRAARLQRVAEGERRASENEGQELPRRRAVSLAELQQARKGTNAG